MKKLLLFVLLLALTAGCMSCDEDDTVAETVTTTAEETTLDETTEAETAEETTESDTTVEETAEGDATEAGTEEGGGGNTGGTPGGNTGGSENHVTIDVGGDVSGEGSGSSGGTPSSGSPAPSAGYEPAVNYGVSSYPLMMDGYSADMSDGRNIAKISLGDIKPGVYVNDVYIGYDGWMFYGDSIDSYTGAGLYTSYKYDSIKNMMQERASWLQNQGIKLYVVLAPNKNSVYSDYMCSRYTTVSGNTTVDTPMGSWRRIDQIKQALTEVGITVVDPTAELREAAKTNQVYYKLDTHWNAHGAYIAYRKLMTAIRQDYPNAVLHEKSEYQIDYYESYMKDQPYGLGYYDTYSEKGPVYTLASGTTARLISTYGDVKAQFTENGQWRFAYVSPSGYVDNLRKFQYRNAGNSSAPSIYMIRDSFSVSMVPFLKDSFYRSIYNWQIQLQEDEISSAHPDIVIMEVAERNIVNFFNTKAHS